MSEERSLIKNFQNHSVKKKEGYINPYIEKSNIDPAEKEKINKIKIKQALKEFSKDNLID
jgi:hypothetical protein